MQGIPLNERKRLGALLDDRPQTEVMAMIPQFSQAETDNFVAPPAQIPEALGVLMFNMERGVNLPEIQEFLRDCPDIQPFDVILANELDDGCARSGNKNTARELAQAFGLNYAWGLEFIELVNDENAKGFHGNAVFSRWPIRRAGVIRLPEQYNWYFDRQKRIGGRLAVFAELDVGGQPVGAVSIHLENRTHGEGRKAQMAAILEAVRKELVHPGLHQQGLLAPLLIVEPSHQSVGRFTGAHGPVFEIKLCHLFYSPSFASSLCDAVSSAPTGNAAWFLSASVCRSAASMVIFLQSGQYQAVW